MSASPIVKTGEEAKYHLIQKNISKVGLGEAAKREVGTGANHIPDMSSFNTGNTNSFRLPTGHFVQFGSGQTISGGFTQSYPTPFPTICQALLGVVYSTLGVRSFIATNTSDRAAANMNVVDTNNNWINVTVGYIAIGH
ncbi:gp53-like domain-containing protein [Escherichia coli]|uniref:gp53-like domain-containing protein n=1 Tax=Escherichia coli TaxID=562 RepID=UPI0024429784|nr:hypothetical protein [Escherichia coli]